MPSAAGVDVVVVGGGAVGLATALGLATRGRDVIIIDPEPGKPKGARASILWPGALDALAAVGAESAAHVGIERPTLDLLDVRSGRRHAGVDFGLVSHPTEHPYVLSINQDDLEAELWRLVRAACIPVHAGVVDGISQHATGVTVTAGDAQWRGAYAVAADGARSVGRELLGVQMRGVVAPSRARRTWLSTAEIACPDGALPEGFAEIRADLRARGLSAITKTGPGRWRLIASVTQRSLGSDVHAGLRADVEARAAVLMGGLPWEITATSATPLRNGVANRMAAGRVLLAGDAAHPLSPAGGQGLTIGLGDAAFAAAVLDGALQGSEALARYARVRGRAARRASARADVTGMIEMQCPGWLRPALLRAASAVQALPGVARAAAKEAALLGS